MAPNVLSGLNVDAHERFVQNKQLRCSQESASNDTFLLVATAHGDHRRLKTTSDSEMSGRVNRDAQDVAMPDELEGCERLEHANGDVLSAGHEWKKRISVPLARHQSDAILGGVCRIT